MCGLHGELICALQQQSDLIIARFFHFHKAVSVMSYTADTQAQQ